MEPVTAQGAMTITIPEPELPNAKDVSLLGLEKKDIGRTKKGFRYELHSLWI